MDQRAAFIGAWLTGRYTKSTLCRRFGVSRPTGDKWIGRYEREGLAGLDERTGEIASATHWHHQHNV